ncbi:hypothetical protein K7X08_026367 [Anisodus acutangulus]|uniref:Phosphoribosylformylglycinamidine synthase n=1 Tax=Anisodus acutangulus TaxID=402998 RepID=A0A9Q1R2V7_9SOLA|nr:hypothetical protein K7X08_026367 [Anisodus acutangulus]
MACRTVFLKEPWITLPRNPTSFPVALFSNHKSSSIPLLRYNFGRRSQLLNCSNIENQSSSDDDDDDDDDVEQGPPQEVVLKAISEVSKTEGRVGQTTNVVIGGTVHDDSTNEWLALDKKVNSYPTERGFTAIGTGGDDFVHSMVVAVESVIQQPVREGQVRQKLSSGGKYVSVNIGPIQVVSSEQVQAVYEAMKRDVRMKYFL